MKTMMLCLISGAVLLQSGCSDSKQADSDGGPNPDSAPPSDSTPPDVAADNTAPRDLDTGSDFEPDVVLGDNYGLEIVGTLQACSTDRFAKDQVPLVPDRKGRLTLRSGMHVLLKDSDQFELNLIEALEIGPSRTKITPTAAGHVVQKETYSGDPSFVFTQQLDVDERVVEVQLNIVFENGSAPVKTLDVESLSNRQPSLAVTIDNWTVSYGPCDYTFYTCVSRRFELSGDDVLETETCNLCPGGMICKSDLGGMPRARFSREGNITDLSDHFNLAHSFRHHNWGQDSLVIFDNPVGAVHGIYVGTEDYPNQLDYKTASYLGADLQVIETRDVLAVKPSSW